MLIIVKLVQPTMFAKLVLPDINSFPVNAFVAHSLALLAILMAHALPVLILCTIAPRALLLPTRANVSDYQSLIVKAMILLTTPNVLHVPHTTL